MHNSEPSAHIHLSILNPNVFSVQQALNELDFVFLIILFPLCCPLDFVLEFKWEKTRIAVVCLQMCIFYETDKNNMLN